MIPSFLPHPDFLAIDLSYWRAIVPPSRPLQMYGQSAGNTACVQRTVTPTGPAMRNQQGKKEAVPAEEDDGET